MWKPNNPEKEFKDIVFINQDSGYLMIDIVNVHVNAGYSCILVAGRIVERSIALDSSVIVEKIIRYNRDSVAKRLFTWLWATLQIIWIIKTKYRKSKLFIVSNPPLATLIPLVVNNSYSILIFDIFPDAIVDLGFSSEKWFFVNWWKKANRKVYSKADRIFTISEGMKLVLQNNINDREIELVSIWSDNIFLKRIEPSINHFITKHNLQGKFVVLYSGNIGLSGQIDTLVDIAANTTGEDIIFVIIGEGAKKKWLEFKVAELKLRNVLVLPWQPVEDLPYSLSSANVAVVGTEQKASKLSMPSKIFSYLSVGAPILGLADEDAELANFIKQYKIGRTFNSSMLMESIKYIEWLKCNPEEWDQISKNSLITSEKFTNTNATKFL